VEGLGKGNDTDLLRKKIIDMPYTEWKKMGFSKGTLHYMKQNAMSDKPFTLNAHVGKGWKVGIQKLKLYDFAFYTWSAHFKNTTNPIIMNAPKRDKVIIEFNHHGIFF
jgi:CRISPR-associated protein Cas1